MNNRICHSFPIFVFLIFVFTGFTAAQNYNSDFYIDFTKTSLVRFVAQGDIVTIDGTLKNATGVGISNYRIGVEDGLERMSKLGPTTDQNGNFSFSTTALYSGVAEVAFILPDGYKQAIYVNISLSPSLFSNSISGFRHLNILNDTENDYGITVEVDNVARQAVLKPGQDIQALVTESIRDHFPLEAEFEGGVGVGIGIVDVSATTNAEGTIKISTSVGEGWWRGKVYATSEDDYGLCYAPGVSLPINVKGEVMLCVGTDNVSIGAGISAGIEKEISFTLWQPAVVSYPSASGVVMNLGLTYVIKWTKFSGTDVKIELIKGNSSLSSVISSSTPNDGEYEWTIPTSLSVGTDYKIRITSTSNSEEVDDSNREFTIANDADLRSDLIPVNQSLNPAMVQAGSNVTVYCAENNLGPVPSGANVISIHLSADDILNLGPNGDTYLGEISVASVPANSGSNIYSQPITIPLNTVPGNYYVFFSADGGQAINEIFEDNNFASIPLTVSAGCISPTTQATTFTSSGITNTTMTVGWTRGNGNAVLVVARQGSVVNADPVNGISYSANSTFGNGTQIGTGNYVVYNGTGTSVNMTTLTSGTTYYYAVYEYSSGINCYKTPTLMGNSSTTGSAVTVTDIDGNVYSIVTIGTQTWMGENLRTTRYNDGSSIPPVTDGTQWAGLSAPAYCWYNNDATSFKNLFGALYNWFSVNTGKLCPTSWHVPTDTEWTTLTNYLGGESVAGGKLRETGTTHWLSPNTGATNETGFTALPGGTRSLFGDFFNIGWGGIWWSTTEESILNAWARSVYNSGTTLYRETNLGKNNGFSVRCLQDPVHFLPVLTTTSLNSITKTTAISGGNITSDGDAPIIARGVCWSTAINPTINNSKTVDGTGTGSYVSNISNLIPGITYYVRAYATNTAGTSYGDNISFSTLPDSPASAGREIDSLALVALYNSTNGPNWTYKTNWLVPGQPITSWYGITISSDRVTSINLTSNNLSGSIPKEIGNLTYLWHLILPYNLISGSTPTEIGNLTNLRYLGLAGNQLSGSIPSEIGNLINLQTLDLQTNQLSGSIPPEIGFLINLQYVDLKSNKLTGSIPFEISNLTNLHTLSLSLNQLTGNIPAEISNLTNLSSLYLLGNELSGNIPLGIGNLTNLQYLFLNSNQLTGNIPAEIGNMASLKVLYLNSNQLFGSIPIEIGNLTNLNYLYLNSNQLTGSVPSEFNSLSNLHDLRLENNHFQNLPSLNLIHLQTLLINDNKFTFEDIEPNINVPIYTFFYSPQDSIGTKTTITKNSGDVFSISITCGGTHNQYQWYKDGTIISGANSSSYEIPQVQSSDAGSYHCAITNSIVPSLTIYSRPTNLVVNISSLPEAPIIGQITQPTCILAIGSVVLTGLPSNGTWTIIRTPGGNTVTGSGTSTTITDLSPGTYSFTVTNALGQVSESSAPVVINSQPSAPQPPDVSSIIQPTCFLATGSIGLTVLTTPGNWTINPGNITGSGTGIIISGLAPGTYNFSVTNAEGCTSLFSDPIIINSAPVPPGAPTGSSSQSFCSVESHTVADLTATGTNILWYTTSAGGTTLSSATVLVNGTTYYASQTAGGCESTIRFAVAVTLNTSPTAPVISSIIQPDCVTSTGIVTVSGLPSSGILRRSGTIISGTGNTRILTDQSTGSYVFTVTSGDCTSLPSNSVTINNPPSFNTITLTSESGTNSQIRCINSAITNITYSTTGATGTSVTGLPAGLTGSWASNVATISGTPVVSGTYNYSVNLSGGCGTPTATGTITVNPVPASISNQTTSITSGTPFTFTPTGVPAGLTYTWTAPTYTGGVTGGSAQPLPQTSISGSLSIASGSGTASYFVTPYSGNCPGTPFTLSVTVNSSSGQTETTTILTTNRNPGCINNNLTFTVSISPAVGNTGTVEFFSGGSSLGIVAVSGSTASLTTSMPAGNYSITASYSGGGTLLPSTTLTPLVQVVSLISPIITASPAVQSICSGFAFTPINLTGAPVITWSRDHFNDIIGPDEFSSGPATSIVGAFTNLIGSATPVTFSIIGVDANGCFGTTTASVIVNPFPIISDISGPGSICTGSANTVTMANSTPGGVWSSNDPTVATVNAATGLVTGITGGSVIITYSLTNVSGCVNSVIKSLIVSPSSSATLVNNTSICLGGSASLTAISNIQPPIIVASSNNENTSSVRFAQGVPLQYLDKGIDIDLSVYGITSMTGVTITVTTNVSHPRDQEVELYLIAPWGDITNCKQTLPYNQPYTHCFTTGVIPLSNNRGGANANFSNTIFSDAASTAISTGVAPFIGTYRPEVAFNTLAGNPNGTWRLRMVDEISSGYTGVYNSWTISFTLPGSAGGGSLAWSSSPVDPGWTTPASGNLTFSVSPTQTTTYTLTATGSNSCTAVASATVTVLPTAVANAGTDISQCNNGSFTLGATVPTSGNGTWSLVSGTATITTPSSATSSVIGVPAGTSATLRWTVTNPPCTSMTDDIVLTNSSPPIAIPVSICQGAASAALSSTACPTVGPSTAGSIFPTTGTNVTGVGTIAWTNPGNVKSDNNIYATATVNNATTNYLQATNFGFNIPLGATINGIQVTFSRFESATGAGNDVRDNVVSLIKNGTVTGSNLGQTGIEWPTSEAAQPYGGAANLWGTTWTAADINATNFGVALSVNSTNSRTASIDYIQVSVTYTLTGVLWYTAPIGGTSLQTGNTFDPINDPEVIAAGAPYSSLTNTNTPGTYSFYAECAASAGCRSTVANYVIKPSPAQPGAFTTSTAVVCPPVNGVVYTVPNDPTVTYIWSYSGTGATIVGSTNTITINFAAGATSGTLSVTATTLNGCGTSIVRTLAITTGVPPQPEAFTASTTSVCQGLSNVAYAVPLDPTVTYTWSYSGTGATITGTTNSVTVNYSLTATSGNLSVTATNSCGTSIARTLAITVNPLPVQPANFTTSKTLVCRSENNVIYTVPNDTTVTYTWTYSGAGATITPTGNSASINFSGAATSGTLSVTATNSCGTSIARTLAITVNTVPGFPGTITGNTPVCQGSSQTYSIPVVAGATSYTWTAPHVSWTGTSTTNSITYTVGTNSGTLSVTANNACGSSTAATKVVGVTALPVQPGAFTTSTPTVCQGQNNVTYTVPAVGGTTSYAWSYSGTGTTIVGTTNSVTVSYSAIATSGTLSVSANNACGSGTARTLAITVYVLPAQPGAFTASSTPVCQGATGVVYSVPAVSGATSYNWTYSGTGVTINGLSNSVSLDFSALATPGTLSVFSMNGCGQSALSRGTSIVVNPSPVTPTASSNSPVCAGATINLSTPAVSSATYAWTGPNGFTSIAQNPSIAGATLAAAGTYNVTVTVSGCTSPAGSTTVIVNTSPSIPTAVNNGPICAGATLNLTAPAVSGATYAWTGPNGFTSALQNPSISNITTAFSGIYNVTVSVSGCTSLAGSTIATVNTSPPVIENQATSVLSGVPFTFTPAGVPGGTNYTWTFPTYSGGVTGGSAQLLPQTNIFGSLSIASGSGTATYTVTPQTGICFGTSFTLTVTVNSSLQTSTTTSLTTSKNPACDNTTITLSATIDAVAATGTVSFYDGGTLIGSTSTITNGVASLGSLSFTAGTHNLIAVYSGDATYEGSTGALTQQINALASNTITAAPLNQTVCSGNPFTAIVFTSSASWTRNNIDNLVGLDPFGPGASTQVDGVLTNLTISNQTTVFTIAGSINGCVSTVQATVTVNPPPTVAAISGPDLVCKNSSIMLTDATSGGVWSSSNPFVATVNSSTGVVTGVSAGNAIITYTVTLETCVNSVIKSINVNDAPTVSVTGGTTICAGQSIPITGVASISPAINVGASNNDNSSSVNFQQGNPLAYLDKSIIIDLSPYGIASLSQISNISVTVNLSHPKDQEVEVYLVSPGGTILNSKPTIPYNQPYTQTFTVGQVIVLANNNGGAGSNFVNTVFSDLGAANIAVGTAPFTGTYRPIVPFSSLNQAINPSGVWTLRMIDEISSGYTGVFQNWSISFTIPATGGGGTTMWTSTPNDTAFQTETGGANPGTYLVSPSAKTTYTLTASSQNGCVAIDSTTVTISPASVSNAGIDQANCNSGSFTLAGDIPASGTGLWTLVSGTATIATPASPTSAVTGVPAGTSATLRWTVTNSPCATVYDDIVLSNVIPPTATGITICPGVTGSVTATATCPPNVPTSISNIYAGTGTASGAPLWQNPTRVNADDNSFTTDAVAASSTGGTLNATTFNFAAIPVNAVITGVQLYMGKSASTAIAISDNSVRLIVGGAAAGNNYAQSATWGTAEAIATYGGTMDTWGLTLNPAQITNNANFGVAIQPKNSSVASVTANIDYVRMTITYTIPGVINWFTASSGGTSIGTGSPFNPVPSGLANTNTPGTYPFYAACSTSPDCRSTAANFIISPNNTIALTSEAGTLSQTVCINNPIANITYSTIGATGATITALPAGVTGSWAANVVTISGMPTSAGTFNYMITLTGGCGTVTDNGTIVASEAVSAPIIGTITQPDCNVTTGSVVLSGLPSVGSWTLIRTPGSVTTTGSGSSITITGLAAGTYFYTVSNAESCVSQPSEAFIINEPPTIPTLTTKVISSVTQTTAVGGGDITSDGGAALTERGVCWALTTSPTKSDFKTADGIGNGSFVSNLTGLQPGTTYYVKAYATNCTGTAYGNQVVFQTLSTIHFAPVWWPGNGMDHMNLYALTAKLDGVDLQPGDEIGIFDGDVCVGIGVLTQVLTGSNYLECMVSGDDPDTPVKDGFTTGNTIAYKVWDSSAGSEVSNVQAVYVSGIGIFEPGATAAVDLAALTSITQDISLSTGWNIMSFAAQPSDMSLKSIVTPLITAGTLTKIQNEKGSAIEKLPAPIGWVDNIGLMKVSEGYKIKVTGNTTLSVTGQPVTLPYTISLDAGWNIMGYPSMTSQAALTSFNPLITAASLLKVQDEAGNAIEKLPAPIGWIDNIHNLSQGNGYKVKTSVNTSLTISNTAKGVYRFEEVQINRPNHFKVVYSGNGLDQMNIYIKKPNVAESVIKPGDVIGVFDGDLCVGAVLIDDPNQEYCMVVASLDDPNTPEKDGFKEGNNFELRLWDNQSGIERKAQKVELDKGYYNQFEKLGTSVLTVDFETKIISFLGDAYPNPSTDRTIFTFQVEKESMVRLEIYNMEGDMVKVLVDQNMSGGMHHIEWDNRSTAGTRASSGVYFYRLKLNNFLQTKKLVIR